MKAPDFLYRRPAQLDEALALLADADNGAQVLAGGQSLMPTMNMRLSAPAMLVDINRIEALNGIEQRDGGLRIGALVRHAEVAASSAVARSVPLIALAMPHVAHMAVRNRGTTCGSLALADPSAEMPAVAVTLNAGIVLQRRGGTRTVAARDFFQGLYETAREADEMVTEVIFPVAQDDEIFAFTELSRRHGDFATVGLALRARKSADALHDFVITIFGSEPAPLLTPGAAALTVRRDAPDTTLAAIATTITADMSPMDSHQGRGETKRTQAAVLLRRALRDTLTRAYGAAS